VPFNLDFEFEQKISTEFGIRHMMWQELQEVHNQIKRTSGLRYKPKKKKKMKKSQTPNPNATRPKKDTAGGPHEAPF